MRPVQSGGRPKGRQRLPEYIQRQSDIHFRDQHGGHPEGTDGYLLAYISEATCNDASWSPFGRIISVVTGAHGSKWDIGERPRRKRERDRQACARTCARSSRGRPESSQTVTGRRTAHHSLGILTYGICGTRLLPPRHLARPSAWGHMKYD